MSAKRAHINPEMLIWARKTMKLSVELASKKIGITIDKLETWEKGEEFPTINQLYKIANVYKRPFALFYFPKPPKHFKPLKDFRRFLGKYLPLEDEEYQLEKEILLFHRKREIALDVYNLLNEDIPVFGLKLNQNIEPEKFALKVAEFLKINYQEVAEKEPGYDALNYWKKFLESKGILIFQTTKVPLELMRGACIAEDKLPVIIINSNDSVNGRIFSMFHELVHIVLREDGVSNFRFRDKDQFDPVEVFCNRVAAEMLVPSRLLFEDEIIKAHDLNQPIWADYELRQLANNYCVSKEVILRRLLSLNKTDNSFYQYFRDHQKIEDLPKPSGGDYYRSVVAKNGWLFINLVLQGYYQDKLSTSTLADYLQVKISNLPKLENRLYA